MRGDLFLLAILFVWATQANADVCAYIDPARNLHFTNVAPEKTWKLITCGVGKAQSQSDCAHGKEVYNDELRACVPLEPAATDKAHRVTTNTAPAASAPCPPGYHIGNPDTSYGVERNNLCYAPRRLGDWEAVYDGCIGRLGETPENRRHCSTVAAQAVQSK